MFISFNFSILCVFPLFLFPTGSKLTEDVGVNQHQRYTTEQMVALRFRQEIIQIHSIRMWHLNSVMYSKWQKTLSHPLMHLGLRLTPFNSHQQPALLKVRGRKERKHIRVRDQMKLQWSSALNYINISFFQRTFLARSPNQSDGAAPMCLWFFHCEAGCCLNRLRL